MSPNPLQPANLLSNPSPQLRQALRQDPAVPGLRPSESRLRLTRELSGAPSARSDADFAQTLERSRAEKRPLDRAESLDRKPTRDTQDTSDALSKPSDDLADPSKADPSEASEDDQAVDSEPSDSVSDNAADAEAVDPDQGEDPQRFVAQVQQAAAVADIAIQPAASGSMSIASGSQLTSIKQTAEAAQTTDAFITAADVPSDALSAEMKPGLGTVGPSASTALGSTPQSAAPSGDSTSGIAVPQTLRQIAQEVSTQDVRELLNTRPVTITVLNELLLQGKSSPRMQLAQAFVAPDISLGTALGGGAAAWRALNSRPATDAPLPQPNAIASKIQQPVQAGPAEFGQRLDTPVSPSNTVNLVTPPTNSAAQLPSSVIVTSVSSAPLPASTNLPQVTSPQTSSNPLPASTAPSGGTAFSSGQQRDAANQGSSQSSARAIADRLKTGSGPNRSSLSSQPQRAFSSQLQHAVSQAIEQVRSAAQSNSAAGTNSVVTLRLSPESLGSVKVQLQVDGDKVKAKFEATTRKGQQLLESSIESLRAALGEKGLKADEVSVTLAQRLPERDFGLPSADPRNGGESLNQGAFNLGPGFADSHSRQNHEPRSGYGGQHGHFMGTEAQTSPEFAGDSGPELSIAGVSYHLDAQGNLRIHALA